MNKKKLRQQKEMIIGNNSYTNEKKINNTNFNKDEADNNGNSIYFLKHKRTHALDKDELIVTNNK